jgi:pimeloyl-ACP methyl ester carboxylesterase
MCATTSEVQWRHRPLLYYAISHGVGKNVFTPAVMRSKGFERGVHAGRWELSYWHRPALEIFSQREALVFIHGVGFGPAPYADFVDSIAGADTHAVVLELDGVAQRVFSRTPSPDDFAAALDGALSDLGISRAVLVGHSLGSAFASYAASRDARRAGALPGGMGGGRYSGLVFIDPIAANLHHARTVREFVFTPVETMQQSVEDFLFKKVNSLSAPNLLPCPKLAACLALPY